MVWHSDAGRAFGTELVVPLSTCKAVAVVVIILVGFIVSCVFISKL